MAAVTPCLTRHPLLPVGLRSTAVGSRSVAITSEVDSVDRDSEDDATVTDQATLIEGTARVVAIEDGVPWLEPEQTSSCGGCAASGLCGAKGIGTAASQLARRRFPLPDAPRLVIGERVVVGVSERALLKASGIAYALPLVFMFGAGGVAQWLAGSDGITMVSMVAALGVGLIAVRRGGQVLSAHGQLAPRFLRRAGFNETCPTTAQSAPELND